MRYAYLDPKDGLIALERSNLVVSPVQIHEFLCYCLSDRKPGEAIGGERDGGYKREICLIPDGNIRDLFDLSPGKEGCHICLQMGKVSAPSPMTAAG